MQDDCAPCRIDDDYVSLTLIAHGPKGDARVLAVGRRVDGQWRYDWRNQDPASPRRGGFEFSL